MKYPESQLSSDETIVFDVHHHPVVLWRPVAVMVVYLALWIMLLVISGAFRGWPALIAGVAGLLVICSFLGWRVLQWSHTNLVLTDHRLIYKTGFFTRRSRELPVGVISDVSSSQLVLGRIFGFGDLVMETSGEYGKAPYFDLPHPEELKLEVLERIRSTGGAADDDISSVAEELARAVTKAQPTQQITAVPPERPPLYSEIVDQIERLDQLRRKGSLSDDEFRKAKESLIKRLDEEPNP